MSDRLEKENDMTDEKTWDKLSDYYAGHTPEIIREIQVPDRALTADDLDDIFAGRPLADQPRPKADILAKTYLTKEIETEARSVMKSEGIGMSALLRKALVSYLDSHSKQAGLAV